MTTPTIPQGSQYMNATLYTGTGASLAVTNGVAGQSFQPDLVWIKSRSAATDHKLTDSVRGVTKALISDTTGAETTDTNGLTAFGTGGFTVGSDTIYNNSGATYVAWQWKAGQGTTSSNTSGSITSTVSANASAGFSVVTWTAGASGGATIGHGLGVTPAMIIVKQRNGSGDWWVWHQSLSNPAQSFLQLDNTTAAGGNANAWNNTAPNSSVFSQVNNYIISASGTAVAYCWAQVAGYSAFGSYTGNGSTTGPFVYTGFRPKLVIIKETTTGGVGSNWFLYDSSRDTYNPESLYLVANATGADASYGAVNFYSNGFGINVSGLSFNQSGNAYVYAAWAENPFKYANAR